MLIKRKTREGKVYGYQMLLRFKTLVIYKKIFLTSLRTTASVLKQLLSDITRYFAEHCLLPGANIQAWLLV